jgi:hypothetical protein
MGDPEDGNDPPPPPPPAAAPTYGADIEPLFRPFDVTCMTRRHIRLADATWMCDPAASFGFPDHGNARHVYQRLSDQSMPPDGPWSSDMLATYLSWMDSGFLA